MFFYFNGINKYRKDAQANIVALLDNKGAVVVKYKYDAWGKCNTVVLEESATEIATLNPFRYRSYYLDTETGLYFLKTRYGEQLIMKKEKVISFLNIDPVAKNDKSLPKICAGFNIGITVFIFIFAILLFRPDNLVLYFAFFIWDIAYFIFLLLYRNPLWQIPLTAIGLFSSALKSFWGYAITSKFEFAKAQLPMFTFLHASAVVVTIVLIAYMWTNFFQVYKLLKEYSLETAKKKIAMRNPMPKWAAFIAAFSGSPMILVRLFRDDFQNFGIGLGFCMWSLGLLFIFLFALLIPKLIVFIKFHVWNFPEIRH